MGVDWPRARNAGFRVLLKAPLVVATTQVRVVCASSIIGKGSASRSRVDCCQVFMLSLPRLSCLSFHGVPHVFENAAVRFDSVSVKTVPVHAGSSPHWLT